MGISMNIRVHFCITVHQVITLSKSSLGASKVAQGVKNPPAMQEMWIQSLCWEGSLEEETWQPSPVFLLENPMNRGAWQATVHSVTKSQI